MKGFCFVVAVIMASMLCCYRAEPVMVGQVYNITFPDGVDTLYFEVSVPYNESLPVALRTVIVTYLPLENLIVSGSFNITNPTSSNTTYSGLNKDGSFARGIMWADDVPQGDQTLYVSVQRSANFTGSFFGLNVEMPTPLSALAVASRYETTQPVQPWQTKWFLVNLPLDQPVEMTGVRGEFCDEPDGPVEMSIVFPETDLINENEEVNPCACDSVIVEDREFNVISRFGSSADQLFILNEAGSKPIYAGVFYAGPYAEPGADASYSALACPENSRRKRDVRGVAALNNASAFSVRITLYPQELFPAVRTKYTKPNRVNNDLIANVYDTNFCDFWESSNFTAYVSNVEYSAFDSSCFLEKYAHNFSKYSLQTLSGANEYDRVLVIKDFYEHHKGNGTYFNIVHSNQECGSYAYFEENIPEQGWSVEKDKQWLPWSFALVIVFGVLFVIFLIVTIFLAARLRRYKNYSGVPLA